MSRRVVEVRHTTLAGVVVDMQKHFKKDVLSKAEVTDYYNNRYPKNQLTKMLKHLNL